MIPRVEIKYAAGGLGKLFGVKDKVCVSVCECVSVRVWECTLEWALFIAFSIFSMLARHPLHSAVSLYNATMVAAMFLGRRRDRVFIITL